MKKHFLLFCTLIIFSLHLAHAEKAPAKKSDLDGLTTDEIEIYQHGEIGTGSLVGGGLLGTFVGFGTGHIVYGKYASKGWIFTLGEAVSLGIVVAGAVSTLTNCSFGDKNGCSKGSGLMTFGSFAFLGFRIWEIIDVWTIPGFHNSKYRAIKARVDGTADSEFHLAPLVVSNGARSGYGLQAALTF